MWLVCFLCEERLHSEKDSFPRLIMGEVMNSELCEIRGQCNIPFVGFLYSHCALKVNVKI